MSETEDKNVVIPNEQLSLNATVEDIANGIMQEKDPDKLKNLVQLFNLNLSKKSVARSISISNLIDHVTDQMGERLTKRADEFSNLELINYLKVLQDSLDKSSKAMEQVNEAPVINFTQNNNTVNIGQGDSTGIDRESRERIMDAVSAYLSSIQNKEPVYEVPFAEQSDDNEHGESETKNAE